MAGKQRYLNLVDNALIVIADVSVDGEIIYGNRAGVKMLGYDSLDELRKENIIKFWHRPEQREAFISKLRQDGHVNSYEIEYVAKSGEIVYALASAVLDGDMISMVIIDVTKSRHAEIRLRTSDEILTHMEEGVYLVRAEDGIILMANPAIERMLGYAAEELIGKNESIVTATTGDAEEAVRKSYSILNEKGKWRGELLKIRKDGSSFWSYANVSSFDHPAHGKVWVAVHTDITSRKKVDAENAILLHDLGERLKEQQCMYSISNSIATKA